MKYFVNNKLGAPNVMTAPFEPSLLDGLRAAIE